tara:strand:- start:36357 stop:36674 length:318 start_codon:yes stop_codon:yes gene_type:complete
MKSPFLILFIVMNLLAINMVSASNTYSDKVTESHLVSAQHDDSSSTDTHHDESACSHFCHISSHMVGLVSQIITPSVVRDPASYYAFTKQFYSFIHTPPSQPPKA